MLKSDIGNYFRQFTKTLFLCFPWNTTHLVMCNYVWIGQLNVCAKYGIISDKNICFIEYNCKVYWM